MNRSLILDGFFLLILTALSLAFFQILRPFMMDIVVAVFLVIISEPLFNLFRRRLRMRPGLAAALTVLIIFILVSGILTFIAAILTAEAAGGFQTLRERWPELVERLKAVDYRTILGRIPVVGPRLQDLQPVDIQGMLDDFLGRATTFVVSLAQKSFSSVTALVLHFILTLMLTFSLFVHGPEFLRRIKELIPLSDRETDEFTAEIPTMTKATVISTLVVGLIEGVFGTLIFLVFRLPSPLLWGIVITIISVIPVIGTNMVVIPAGILSIIGGRVGAGTAIIILGIAGVSANQYVLKPKLLGGRSGLHPALVLLSTIGGIAWLGIIGFLIGPLLASLFIVVWRQFGTRFRRELANRSVQETGATDPEAAEPEPADPEAAGPNSGD